MKTSAIQSNRKRYTLGLAGVLLLIAIPTWAVIPVEVAKLTASDGAAGDIFGVSVSLSGDTALIGSRFDDDAGVDSGSAYMFERMGGTWVEVAKLTASDAAAGDEFGLNVSVSGDTALVGATHDDDAGINSGSVYVFENIGGAWMEVAKLTAADGAANDQFGVSVSVSGDTALIGTRFDANKGFGTGAAYVFKRTGGAWVQEAKLTASDAAAGDEFAITVAVSGDTALIGAHLNDDAGVSSGSAYVFERTGGTWTEVAKLTASDAAAFDQFGFNVSLSGNTALIGVGTPLNLMPADAGAAYVFEKIGGAWTEVARLTASDGEPDDLFGHNVSLSGNTALIGALLDDDAGVDSGSAYVFEKISGAWMEVAKLIASDGAANDWFGLWVSISGDTALIGALLDDHGGSASGSSYVFCLSLAPEQIGLIIDEVEALAISGALNPGRSVALVSLLEATQFQIEHGNATAAINQLDAFVNQVNNLIRNGTLTEEQGGQLINAALNVFCG